MPDTSKSVKYKVTSLLTLKKLTYESHTGFILGKAKDLERLCE